MGDRKQPTPAPPILDRSENKAANIAAQALAETHETTPWEELPFTTRIYYLQQTAVVLNAYKEALSE